MKKPNKPQPINRSWQEESAAKNARIGATLDLIDISDVERAFLATCQKIKRRDSGSTSPFENFFFSLVVSVENGLWPTPDDVARELEEFREDFECMSNWTKAFLEVYPQKPAASEVEQPAEAAHA